jgi:hypothetical protein
MRSVDLVVRDGAFPGDQPAVVLGMGDRRAHVVAG